MKTINLLLQRFKNISPPDDSVRKKFKEIVFKKYGFELNIKKIKVQNNIIYFAAPSVLKQEVILDKRNIINQLNKILNIKIKNLI
jgi:hypothetical protein